MRSPASSGEAGDWEFNVEVPEVEAEPQLAVAAPARLRAENLDEEKSARLVDEAIKDLSDKLH